MSAAVEILVPPLALPSVRKALGSLSASFHTRPSQRPGQRLIISPLTVLDTPSGRSSLEGLLRSASRRDGAEIVFFAIAGVALGLVVAEGLARVARQAREAPYIAPNTASVRRLVLAQRAGAEKELMASASIDDGNLVAWSCEPRRFEVAVAEIPALAAMPADVLANFELSQSGSRIRWSAADVDLNLDTIREYADPDMRREHEAMARKEAARYAAAIRRFREQRGLRQTDIDGLTDRQVRRLEEGNTVPHIDTLKKLATAHGLAIEDYLKELAKRSRPRPRARREPHASA